MGVPLVDDERSCLKGVDGVVRTGTRPGPRICSPPGAGPMEDMLQLLESLCQSLGDLLKLTSTSRTLQLLSQNILAVVEVVLAVVELIWLTRLLA